VTWHHDVVVVDVDDAAGALMRVVDLERSRSA
jgi:hypothetical protein